MPEDVSDTTISDLYKNVARHHRVSEDTGIAVKSTRENPLDKSNSELTSGVELLQHFYDRYDRCPSAKIFLEQVGDNRVRFASRNGIRQLYQRQFTSQADSQSVRIQIVLPRDKVKLCMRHQKRHSPQVTMDNAAALLAFGTLMEKELNKKLGRHLTSCGHEIEVRRSQ